jgi:hypothetical protein
MRYDAIPRPLILSSMSSIDKGTQSLGALFWSLVFGLWSLVLGPGDLPQQYGYCTVVICSYLLTYLLSMDDRRNGTLPRG